MLKIDLNEVEELKTLDKNYDIVRLTATPDERSEYAYQKVLIRGLENLISQLSQQQKTPLFILISSTSVYGQNEGQWVNESSDTKPKKFNGTITRAAAEIVKKNMKRRTDTRRIGKKCMRAVVYSIFDARYNRKKAI